MSNRWVLANGASHPIYFLIIGFYLFMSLICKIKIFQKSTSFSLFFLTFPILLYLTFFAQESTWSLAFISKWILLTPNQVTMVAFVFDDGGFAMCLLRL